MGRPYDYTGIRNIFIAQVLVAALVVLSTPLNMVVARHDSGGTISDLHMAFWSVCTVGWICAGGFIVVGLTQMRDYSEWFDRAWKIMIAIVVCTVGGIGLFGTAVLLGPMQVRNGIEELEDSYSTYWMFGALFVVVLLILLIVVFLGIVFNRLFLWGLAEILLEYGRKGQAAICRLLFPLGVVTMFGGAAAIIYYYYQALNSTVDSKVMESARFYVMVMGVVWALVQASVILMTWRTWRVGAQSDPHDLAEESVTI